MTQHEQCQSQCQCQSEIINVAKITSVIANSTTAYSHQNRTVITVHQEKICETGRVTVNSEHS